MPFCDALRFLTLGKYRDYYFELDVITLRSFTKYRNVAAMCELDFLEVRLFNPVSVIRTCKLPSRTLTPIMLVS